MNGDFEGNLGVLVYIYIGAESVWCCVKVKEPITGSAPAR